MRRRLITPRRRYPRLLGICPRARTPTTPFSNRPNQNRTVRTPITPPINPVSMMELAGYRRIQKFMVTALEHPRLHLLCIIRLMDMITGHPHQLHQCTVMAMAMVITEQPRPPLRGMIGVTATQEQLRLLRQGTTVVNRTTRGRRHLHHR